MPQKNKRSAAIGATLLFIGLVGLEIALVGKIDNEETPVGAGIALLSTAAAVAALGTAHVAYGVRPAWCGFALLVVRNVVRDTFTVFGVLLRRLAGGRIEDAFIEVPFVAGGDDRESAARRALATAGMSTSPNEIVLTIDGKRDVMHVHVLRVTASKRYSQWWPL